MAPPRWHDPYTAIRCQLFPHVLAYKNLPDNDTGSMPLQLPKTINEFITKEISKLPTRFFFP
jgi:hypothetical protein